MKKSFDSNKKIKKAGIALLIFVLSYAVLSIVLSAVVYSAIFRNIDSDGEFFEYGYSEFSQKYPRSEHSFPSGKNTLRGYFYECASSPSGVIVIANGIGSNADSHLAEIMYFVDHGWNVFAYNGTGVSTSEGDSLIGLSQARIDFLSALRFIEQEYDIPVVAYGHSCGGYAVASSLDESGLSGAVCVSGFDLPTETMYYKAHEYVGFLADIEKPFLMLEHWFVFGKEGYVSAIDSINKTDTPVMVFFGENDEVVPAEINLYGKRDLSKNPNAIFVKMKDGHSSTWLTDKAEDYITSLRGEYDDLSKKYNGKIPEIIDEEFANSIDYDLANELDTDFMDGIIEFFSESVKLKTSVH